MSRVLVIDDEAAIRDLMVAILERDGYEAVAVESPERALELLDGVSVVVSDVVMPGLTGLELLDEVRVRRPRMPFVLMSGAGAYDYLGEAVARGADGFVLKPFAHAELLRAVAAALQGTAASAQTA